MGNLIIDTENYRIIKSRYNKAEKEKKESFIFKGNELLTSYAKYLIEYMELVLKIKKQR